MNEKLIGAVWSLRRVPKIQCDVFETERKDIIILACAVFFLFLNVMSISNQNSLVQLLATQLAEIFRLMDISLSILSYGITLLFGFYFLERSNNKKIDFPSLPLEMKNG